MSIQQWCWTGYFYGSKWERIVGLIRNGDYFYCNILLSLFTCYRKCRVSMRVPLIALLPYGTQTRTRTSCYHIHLLRWGLHANFNSPSILVGLVLNQLAIELLDDYEVFNDDKSCFPFLIKTWFIIHELASNIDFRVSSNWVRYVSAEAYIISSTTLMTCVDWNLQVQL